MPPAPHRIYLVEDHAVMRMAISVLLDAEAGLDLCGTAGSAEEALNVGAWTRCDLLLTDVGLPGMDGIALVGRVHAERPGLPVVVVSASAERAVAGRAEAAGASAYLSKDGLGDTLAPTLRRVLERAPPRETGGRR